MEPSSQNRIFQIISLLFFISLIPLISLAEDFRTPQRIDLTDTVSGRKYSVSLPPLPKETFRKYLNTCETDRSAHPYQSGLPSVWTDIPIVMDDRDYLIWTGDARYGEKIDENWQYYYFIDITFKSVEACLNYDLSEDQLESISVTIVLPEDRTFFPQVDKLLKLKWTYGEEKSRASLYQIIDLDNSKEIATGESHF